MTDCCDIIIFGGLGDLSRRKLLPALYRCELNGQLPQQAKIYLTTREHEGEERELLRIQEWLSSQLKADECSKSHWESFSARISFYSLDVVDGSGEWDKLREAFSCKLAGDRVFYLAMPPSLYGATCEQLSQHGLINECARVVLEKPLGYDRETSDEINNQVGNYFAEQCIFRIDHYLGKETVQNLMALRFANIQFEPLWNSNYIDHVQISLTEQVGLEGRTDFYDQAGAMRDMVQSHLLQLLCLVAMEPPHKLQADNIRTEKLKVLQALRPIEGQDVLHTTVRGQYVEGMINGSEVPGYLDELGRDSNTETFVAIKAHVDNWRWAGVPFYFRTGKRLRQRYAEIVIQFKSVGHNVFGDQSGQLESNRLVIRLQPDEGIQMMLMAKELNKFEMRLQQVPLNLNFAETFENIRSDAYQRLLLNVIHNDLSLFASRDEADLAWAWVDPIIEAWNGLSMVPEPYEAGTWGPDASAALLHSDHRAWHNSGTGRRKRK